MTNDEIRELIRILQETGIAELEVQRGDDRVWICGSRASTQEPAISPILPMTLDSSEQSTLAHSGAAAAGPQLVSAPAPVVSMDEQSNDQTVTSPIVGTYYDAPAPNSPPFVKGGGPGRAEAGAVHHRVDEADERDRS